MNLKNIFFNLINNSILGKVIENLRKIVNVRFVDEVYHQDQNLEEV